jgi:hypothetical protein
LTTSRNTPEISLIGQAVVSLSDVKYKVSMHFFYCFSGFLGSAQFSYMSQKRSSLLKQRSFPKDVPFGILFIKNFM